MKRTDYAREYYRRNRDRLRLKRLESKRRCAWRDEEVSVGMDSRIVAVLLSGWRRFA